MATRTVGDRRRSGGDRAGPLLDAVYADVLAPSFPPDELATRADLVDGLASGATSLATILDPAGAPLAAAVVEWSAGSGILLLPYLAARPGARGGGYAAARLRYRQPAGCDPDGAASPV